MSAESLLVFVWSGTVVFVGFVVLVGALVRYARDSGIEWESGERT